ANLSKKDADHFYRLWYELLAYINNIYKICPTMQEYLENLEKSKIDDQLLFPIREKLWKKPYIIMNYCEANSTLNEEDINIYKSWLKHHLKSRFIIMDFQEEGSLFMPLNENVPTCIYQVLGINNDIRDLFKNKTLPFYIETVILPFKDVIIYDTYINIFQASFDEKTIDILYNQYENLLINNIKTNLN
ncbi:MAG: hypothetical protein LBM99_03440, partial [Bacillales bacterium]|nr:hypothetical protein [Bacillales bacterium]